MTNRNESWWLEHDSDCLPNHIGVSSANHTLLAQVVWCFEGDDRSLDCERNAQVIAEAPRLLDGLRAIRDRLLEGEQVTIERDLKWIEALIENSTGEKI